ncbi:putative GTD-binding domain-containing protein [Lupinus albus]|uniref:Putative GTD-binding domain-containing protein n=1 Tax=Lupinus albus TaxID=3870 RepID=A0A6A4Q407_LUPAL|nr:putative GTD-binding domain-containing protein [Lupinus albus]
MLIWEETGTSSVMAQTQGDVAAMKETLHAQQQLLQKLCIELDQEREASETAASEALDMILRLQGEKAAVKMEASHYKRVAEEKIGHAEATLEIFEELMYQKEMEIASLEFQIQAYKHKFLSLGCDLNASEFEFPDDLLLNRTDQQNGQSSTIRRLHSLPPLSLKSSFRVARHEERSTSPVPIPVSDVIPMVVDENANKEVSHSPPSLDLTRKSVEFAYGTIDSYWEQVKKLDEKVKVVSDSTEGEKRASLYSRKGRSYSMFTQASTNMSSDQIDRLHSTNFDKVNHGEGIRDRKEIANPPCSPNIYDVFEVPQTSEKHKVSDPGRKRLVKWYSQAENRLTKPDSVSEGIVASHVKHDGEKQKGILRVHSEMKIPSPNDMMNITSQKKLGMGVDSIAQAEFQNLHQRIDRLERMRVNKRQEISHEGVDEEQLRLLQDIQSQLTLIQSEMRSWKTKNSTPKDDLPLGCLKEAILHFWL